MSVGTKGFPAIRLHGIRLVWGHCMGRQHTTSICSCHSLDWDLQWELYV